jgi:hypothetical protein
MSPLFKLQNHCSTRAVQLLVQVFHLVFHLHLWCFTLHTTHPAASGRGKVAAQLPRAPPLRLPVSSCATCCLLQSVYYHL